jgi:hypothetical protein
MGGKPTRGAVDNYYFHSGDHVNRVAEGFIFLRKSGRIDASKLLVRPLTETMFRVVAIQKNPELFYRIAYSETIGEAQGIAERKKTLAAMLANVAELGAERMEETIGKASLRDATIGTGVAVDKMLALNRTTAVCADCQLGDAKRGRARRASCGARALRRDLPETERTERRRIDARRVQTTGRASLSGSVQRTRGGSNPHLLSHFYQSRVYHKLSNTTV